MGRLQHDMWDNAMKHQMPKQEKLFSHAGLEKSKIHAQEDRVACIYDWRRNTTTIPSLLKPRCGVLPPSNFPMLSSLIIYPTIVKQTMPGRHCRIEH